MHKMEALCRHLANPQGDVCDNLSGIPYTNFLCVSTKKATVFVCPLPETCNREKNRLPAFLFFALVVSYNGALSDRRLDASAFKTDVYFHKQHLTV